ncbi:MarR family transcriptional regulator [Novosphingobium sp. BL-8A]|uniref:LexA family protein n=1 Tax=Novosphingobium sp. BL-8A TaxID=3127639 RepID=UPI0037577FD0
MIGLTTQQSRLLSYLAGYLASTGGVAPSFDEMCAATGIASKSGIHRLLSSLEERGHVRRIPQRARAIEIVDVSALRDLPTEALISELTRRGFHIASGKA